jgi:hypothetical protein
MIFRHGAISVKLLNDCYDIHVRQDLGEIIKKNNNSGIQTLKHVSLHEDTRFRDYSTVAKGRPVVFCAKNLPLFFPDDIMFENWPSADTVKK